MPRSSFGAIAARRALLATGVLLLVTLPAATAGASLHQPVADPKRGPVVLVGTGGLRWDDIDDTTPTLASLVSRGAIGTLAVRSVRSSTCPVDGWLAVSAGRRAGDSPTGQESTRGAAEPACRAPAADLPTAGGPATVPRWAVYRSQAAADSFEATPGLLGQTLARAGRTSAAIGPGAVIALADESGRVSQAWPGFGTGPGGGIDPAAAGPSPADQLTAALARNPAVLVVDLGAIRDPADRAPGEPKQPSASRADQVTALDTRLSFVLDGVPATATVVIASVADSGTTPHLQLLAARGPSGSSVGDYANALLGASSTRQDGMAQTTDLMPTVLSALGVPRPESAVGSPILPVAAERDGPSRLARIFDLDRAATAVMPIVPLFFNGLIAAQIVLYGLATWVLRRQGAALAARRRVLGWLRRVAVVFATVPAGTFLANLVPWWRAGHPGLVVTAMVIAVVVPLAGLALLGPWRGAVLGPLGVVGAVTSVVLAADVVTGSHLALSSMMGVQPLVAGRFYGLGNAAFALFGAGSILATVAGADLLVRRGRRREAVWFTAGVGVLALVLDGAPGLGADFGGPPAIVPAFALLALMVAGVRVTKRRVVLILAGTVLVLAGISLLDWLRPVESRTHLGRFVQTVIDGGAWPVIRRKAAQNLSILLKPLAILIPFGTAFVALVLARPVAWGVRPLQLAYDRSPVLRPGMTALYVFLGAGFALNDSGATVPAVAATVFIPLLIAASVRALELEDAERLEAAVAAARRPPRSKQRPTRYRNRQPMPPPPAQSPA